jgi:hypothetical protein
VTRAADTTIPVTEALFRGVGRDSVDGDRVLYTGVDIDGTSVNRSKYAANPADAISPDRGDEFAAETSGERFAGTVSTPEGASFYWEAHDLPEEDREAHAEIRPCRTGKGFNKNYRVKGAARALLRDHLAASMRIVYRPPVG